MNRSSSVKFGALLLISSYFKRNRFIPVIKIDQTFLQDKMGNLAPVDLKVVRNTKLEPLYNSLIHQHHYIGYRQIVGNHLKYIAFIGDLEGDKECIYYYLPY